jgi:hypothetical protein
LRPTWRLLDLSDAVAHDAESPLNEFGQLKSEIGGAP